MKIFDKLVNKFINWYKNQNTDKQSEIKINNNLNEKNQDNHSIEKKFDDHLLHEKIILAIEIAKNEYIKSGQRYTAIESKINMLLVLWGVFLTALATIITLLLEKIKLLPIWEFIFVAIFLISIAYALVKGINGILKSLKVKELKGMPVKIILSPKEIETYNAEGKDLPEILMRLYNDNLSLAHWYVSLIQLYNLATSFNLNVTNEKASSLDEIFTHLKNIGILIVILVGFMIFIENNRIPNIINLYSEKLTFNLLNRSSIMSGENRTETETEAQSKEAAIDTVKKRAEEIQINTGEININELSTGLEHAIPNITPNKSSD